ncbi:MAG: hypothetical protein JO043_02100, partial [Candidatus Eremiobacteraeota bacterium]|nr:hypothetical protein [Candidatus Eremiobacteraeota bacterium]
RYFRGEPKIKRVIFKIIPDRNTVLNELSTHEIDLWTPVASSYFDRVRNIPGVTALKLPSYSFNHIDFNLTHPVLQDPAVRQALRMGIDRVTERNKIAHGLGVIQDNMVSPANPAFDARVPTTAFNLAAANQLLDRAGWKRGPEGVRRKGALRLFLVYATSSGTPDVDEAIELQRSWWKQLGVALDVKHYPAPLMFAPYQQGGIIYGGKFDIVTFAWGGDPQGDLFNLYHCSQMPPNGQNVVHYCNPKVDAAMNTFETLYTFRERQPYANSIQQQLQQDVPTIVTSIPYNLYGFNSDLKGFHPNQLNPFDNFMNVDI